jgi:hypothetical protein
MIYAGANKTGILQRKTVSAKVIKGTGTKIQHEENSAETSGAYKFRFDSRTQATNRDL